MLIRLLRTHPVNARPVASLNPQIGGLNYDLPYREFRNLCSSLSQYFKVRPWASSVSFHEGVFRTWQGDLGIADKSVIIIVARTDGQPASGNILPFVQEHIRDWATMRRNRGAPGPYQSGKASSRYSRNSGLRGDLGNVVTPKSIEMQVELFLSGT